MTNVTIAAGSIRRWLELGHADRSARRFVDFWSGDGSWDALPAARQQVIAARMPAVVSHFRALFRDSMTRSTLARLTMPVLCMTGGQTSAATRRLSELLRFTMPRASHMTMSGMGHMGPLTHSAQVIEPVAAFLDSQSMPTRERRALLEAA